ncbi:MAG: Fic family protein [Smithella sp.]
MKNIHFEAPPSERIPVEIGWFLEWWKVSRGNLEGLLRAAIAQFWFVTIHPFEDGNGRIARALTDMALSQDSCKSDVICSLNIFLTCLSGQTCSFPFA